MRNHDLDQERSNVSNLHCPSVSLTTTNQRTHSGRPHTMIWFWIWFLHSELFHLKEPAGQSCIMHGLCGCLASLPKILALKPVSCLWLNLYTGLRGLHCSWNAQNVLNHITLTSKRNRVKGNEVAGRGGAENAEKKPPKT